MKKFLTRLIIIFCLQFLDTSGADNQTDKIIPKTRLTNLNFDCLEGVCKFLDDEDLLNVAQANSYLTEAANYVSKHHGEKIIHITDKFKIPTPEPQNNDLRSKSNQIFLNSSKFHSIIPIIGDGITAVAIDFEKLENTDQVLNDIITCCSEQLTTLQLYGTSEMYPTLNVPFPNVQNVAFEDGTINDNLLRLNTWFPAMKSLKFSNVHMKHPDLVTKNFSNLEHFEAEFDTIKGFNSSKFKEILQLNPQIRSLNILKLTIRDRSVATFFQNSHSDLIEFVNEILPELRELKLGPTFYKLLGTNALVTFRKVMKFDVDFSDWYQFQRPVPFRFEQLKSLAIKFHYWVSNIPSFIIAQTDLTTLKLISLYKKNVFAPDIMNVSPIN